MLRRRLLRHTSFVIGAGAVLAVVLLALAADVVRLHDPYTLNFRHRFVAPGDGQFWFGTDNVGRDLFSRVAIGARVSLVIGLFVMLVSGAAGTVLGALSGFFHALDGPIMRTMDALMAFPSIMLAIAIAATLGQSQVNVVIALSAVYVPSTARIVRSSVMVVREASFIEAAHASGANRLDILARHVLPNALAPLIVQMSFIFAYAVLAEAALSFLGVGTPPPTPSWGNIIADGRSYIHEAPWITLIPGAAVTVTVLGLNLLGDALRDALDPRLITRTIA